MVTEAEVWEALDGIADPEIPVISLVDLGVIRSVDVQNGRVRVEFTPTFLGCPALEVMRDAIAARIAELGADPAVEVISDDSWSTDRITPAGREKLREAGLRPAAAAPGGRRPARAAPEERLPLPVLRLDRDAPGEHLRPDAVPLDPLLHELPPAVRAVQDDLGRHAHDVGREALRAGCRSCLEPSGLLLRRERVGAGDDRRRLRGAVRSTCQLAGSNGIAGRHRRLGAGCCSLVQKPLAARRCAPDQSPAPGLRRREGRASVRRHLPPPLRLGRCSVIHSPGIQSRTITVPAHRSVFVCVHEVPLRRASVQIRPPCSSSG